ncbi:MAG: hypothetical protein ACJZ11_03025 [Candidatus Neomarinimicrobiota bacterium]
MSKKILYIIVIVQIFKVKIMAESSSYLDLEKRVEVLEKQVLKLKMKVNEKSNFINWKDLKLGLSKNKIETSFGHPDRKGKFSNGEEFWGFQNYILKFDKNGKLKNWSKPFLN